MRRALALVILVWSRLAAAEDLDAVARRVIAAEKVAGASVLVMQRGKAVLRKGYGLADLGLEAPVRADTTYHVVGPMLPFTGVAVLQLVERGKLGLDDEIGKYVPELPMQGHRVTIRQLLNHTSGIVDYHYLGDPIEATSRLPKALDEVMALYAGKPWLHAPGSKWDWSISGFQLLVTIVERVSGLGFADYVQQNLLVPAGVHATSYCDDSTVVRGLAHSYRRSADGYAPAHETAAAYNSDLRFCSTVDDLYQLWRAIADRPLLSAKLFAQMATPEGAAVHSNPRDPDAGYGFAMMVNREDSHRRIGQHGSLYGYSGALYDFPEDQLTIVVLTNTEGQNAYAITRALARAALGLPALPAAPAPPPRSLEDVTVTPAERAQLAGTYVVKLAKVGDGLHDSFAQYRRTYRVFDDNGRLTLQALGEPPERLLKQPDGSFALRSDPTTRVTLAARRLTVETGLGPLSGARVGPGDPATFHKPR
jgi:CubicO group peptidase (beta-lactamase class C family)